jgi:4-hydroxy-tetrahydrodipicolinate synthase
MQLNGLGVALITPFDQEGNLDLFALEELVDSLIVSGVNYLVVLGTTAESSVLSQEEKERVKASVIAANAKRVPLILGLGSNDTRALCGAIKAVNANDFDALLSVTPYYNKPTQRGLLAHYKALSQVSELPIVLYNVPSRTGVNLLPETTLELAASSDIFIGIKEACGDRHQIGQLIEHAPKGFEVVSGDDLTAVESILMGASGVISVVGQALPTHTLAAVTAALKKEQALALALNASMTTLVQLLFEEGNPAGVKALMSLTSDITSTVRLPLVDASKDLQTRIAQELDILKAITV